MSRRRNMMMQAGENYEILDIAITQKTPTFEIPPSLISELDIYVIIPAQQSYNKLVIFQNGETEVAGIMMYYYLSLYIPSGNLYNWGAKYTSNLCYMNRLVNGTSYLYDNDGSQINKTLNISSVGNETINNIKITGGYRNSTGSYNTIYYCVGFSRLMVIKNGTTLLDIRPVLVDGVQYLRNMVTGEMKDFSQEDNTQWGATITPYQGNNIPII